MWRTWICGFSMHTNRREQLIFFDFKPKDVVEGEETQKNRKIINNKTIHRMRREGERERARETATQFTICFEYDDLYTILWLPPSTTIGYYGCIVIKEIGRRKCQTNGKKNLFLVLFQCPFLLFHVFFFFISFSPHCVTKTAIFVHFFFLYFLNIYFFLIKFVFLFIWISLIGDFVFLSWRQVFVAFSFLFSLVKRLNCVKMCSISLDFRCKFSFGACHIFHPTHKEWNPNFFSLLIATFDKNLRSKNNQSNAIFIWTFFSLSSFLCRLATKCFAFSVDYHSNISPGN